MKSRGETRKKIERRKMLSQKFAAKLQNITQAVDTTDVANTAGATLGRGFRRQSFSECVHNASIDSSKQKASTFSGDHNHEDEMNEESQGLVSQNDTPSPDFVSHCVELDNLSQNIGDSDDGVNEQCWDLHTESHGQDVDTPSSSPPSLHINDTPMNQELCNFQFRDIRRTLFEFEDVQNIDNNDEEEKVEIGRDE